MQILAGKPRWRQREEGAMVRLRPHWPLLSAKRLTFHQLDATHIFQSSPLCSGLGLSSGCAAIQAGNVLGEVGLFPR
jgi:hypothetical protein